MFSKDPPFNVTMRDLFVEIHTAVYRTFDETPDTKFSDHADLIETFYNFNIKIAKRLPTYYASADCHKLINYGKCHRSV